VIPTNSHFVLNSVTAAANSRDPSATAAARAKQAAIANSPTGRKLRKAAAEFEAQLLSSLWKSMKATFAASGEDAVDPASQSLEDYGVESMCSAVGKAGGLGVGKLIVRTLESKLEPPSSELVQTGKVAP
jgi:Rod binding domain-containing protein